MCDRDEPNQGLGGPGGWGIKGGPKDLHSRHMGETLCGNANPPTAAFTYYIQV